MQRTSFNGSGLDRLQQQALQWRALCEGGGSHGSFNQCGHAVVPTCRARVAALPFFSLHGALRVLSRCFRVHLAAPALHNALLLQCKCRRVRARFAATCRCVPTSLCVAPRRFVLDPRLLEAVLLSCPAASLLPTAAEPANGATGSGRGSSGGTATVLDVYEKQQRSQQPSRGAVARHSRRKVAEGQGEQACGCRGDLVVLDDAVALRPAYGLAAAAGRRRRQHVVRWRFLPARPPSSPLTSASLRPVNRTLSLQIFKGSHGVVSTMGRVACPPPQQLVARITRSTCLGCGGIAAATVACYYFSSWLASLPFALADAASQAAHAPAVAAAAAAADTHPLPARVDAAGGQCGCGSGCAGVSAALPLCFAVRAPCL